MIRILVVLAMVVGAMAAPAPKPRLVVLTDIGGDPDDQQSMIRLMVYANEFDIEGLIASASGTPGELKKDLVQPQLIREVVEAYGQVRPNLVRHDARYPEVSTLLAVIKSGDPNRTVANLGPDSDTEGSRWIIEVVDRPDPRPVNITVWGGAHDLAQALWRVRKDRTPAEVDRFVAKLRVHSIGHQDETGPWILEQFPKLFFILSAVDEGHVLGRTKGKVDSRLSVYRGMYLGGDEQLTSREWITANVKEGHGPLGALYPMKTWTAPNPHSTMKEGDTPSWFYFLPNGLGWPEAPEWGGWGGRFRQVRVGFFRDAAEGRDSVSRWRSAFQRDFAARMDWCVVGKRSGANHAPTAVFNGSEGLEPVRMTVRSGAKARLTAKGSGDPDGGEIRFRWSHYAEPGGQKEPLFEPAEGREFAFTPLESGIYHILLEVSDAGSPALTSYRRAVVTVTRPTR